MDNNAYVYLHRRLDTNEIFYVGIGTQKNFKRAYTKSLRSTWWKSIVKKTDYAVDIIYKNISWERACQYEVNLIAMYGRKDLGLGILVNMTNGGEGACGWIPSEETRIKQRNGNLGKIVSEETKLLISKKNKIYYSIHGGINKGKKASEETKRLIGDSSRTRIQINGNPMQGKKHSSETIDKVSGKNHYRATKIIDTNTGIIYDCIKDAANAYNIKQTTLGAKLRGQNKNNTSLHYLVE
jgi:hypothetical protein